MASSMRANIRSIESGVAGPNTWAPDSVASGVVGAQAVSSSLGGTMTCDEPGIVAPSTVANEPLAPQARWEVAEGQMPPEDGGEAAEAQPPLVRAGGGGAAATPADEAGGSGAKERNMSMARLTLRNLRALPPLSG